MALTLVIWFILYGPTMGVLSGFISFGGGGTATFGEPWNTLLALWTIASIIAASATLAYFSARVLGPEAVRAMKGER